MAKNKAEDRPPGLEHYERLVATRSDIQIKGAKSNYTSMNGHMFSFLLEDGKLGLRLPNDAIEPFRAKYGTGPVIQYGATMRGYVEVPASLLANTRQLKKYFDLSYEYIASLPAKPTTRKKATKKTAKKKTAKKKTAKTKTAKKKTEKTKTAKKKTEKKK